MSDTFPMFGNLILMTDSYKLCHYDMYPQDTEGVYSYFESRKGAQFPFTLFFGLQYLIKRYLCGEVIFEEDIDQTSELVAAHLGNKELFNRKGWEYIVNEYGGRLPLEIKAVPEGSIIPVDNVLMTVENTDPKCYWLTNYIETLLTHVWYSSTVATLSKSVKNSMEKFLGETGDPASINFMLHDFGYRGATSEEAAGIGGLAHLVNFMGTDTIAAMRLAVDYYNADLSSLAFSVPATEHSIMTSLGREGEYQVLDNIMDKYPSGILSVVSDSYDIYKFVDEIVSRKQDIISRDGRFVVRPDSITHNHPSPSELTLWIVKRLWEGYGGHTNSKGYMVLDDHIRVLWGDGIDPAGINDILKLLKTNMLAAENMVFGMGGGLLQRVNRDTQRFAFKSSAQKRSGVWYDVSKSPLDASKTSKAGRFDLAWNSANHAYVTVPEGSRGSDTILRPVFKDGELLIDDNFSKIRERSNG